jgi:23S rRNA pseudouridine2605 synthase
MAVSRLIRIRYGAMVLPRGLKRGAWMELDERDIRALVQAAGGPGDDRPPRPEGEERADGGRGGRKQQQSPQGRAHRRAQAIGAG